METWADSGAMRPLCVFVNAKLEVRYRQSQLKEDVERIRLVLFLASVATLVFIPSDYQLFGRSRTFFSLLGFRIAGALVTWLLAARLKRVQRPVELDRLAILWSALAVGGIVFITSTRPSYYTGHAILNVLSVLIAYCVQALPLFWQTVGALSLSLSLVILEASASPPPDSLTVTALMGGLGLANFVGFITSMELQLWKRRQFLALLRETKLRSGLERAMAEIKTLRGILPICAHCKSVRNDAGYWQQVEIYVREHTHVKFSHSICPECARKYFPQTAASLVTADKKKDSGWLDI